MGTMKLDNMSPDEIRDLYQREVTAKKSLDDMTPDEIRQLHSTEFAGPQFDDSPAETFGKQTLDTGSLGYGPQIIAGAKKLVDPRIEYTDERDKQRDLLTQGENQNPKSSMAGKVAGFVAPMAVPLGELGMGAKALQAGEAVLPTIAKQAGKNMLMATGMSAAKNPGDTQGVVDPLQLEERGQNALNDAPMNATVSTLVGGAQGKLAQMGGKAAEKNYQSLMPRSGNVYPDMQRGSIDPDSNRMKDIGKFVETHGINAGGATIEEIAKRANKVADNFGQKIGEFYQTITPKISKATQNQTALANFDPMTLENELNRSYVGAGDQAKAVTRDTLDIIDDVTKFKKTQGPLDLNDLWEIRKAVAKRANYKSLNAPDARSSIQNEMWADVVNHFNDQIKQNIEQIGPQIGPDASAKLKYLNRSYSLAEDTAKIANKSLASKISSGPKSLTVKDLAMPATVGLGVGAASHNPILGAATAAGGIGLGAAAHALDPKLPSMAANMASNSEQISPYLSRLAQVPQQVGPMIEGFPMAKTTKVDPMMASKMDDEIRKSDMPPSEKAKRLNLLRKHQLMYIGQ